MFYASTLILTLLINNAISNVAFDKSLKSFSSNELSPNPTKLNNNDNDETSSADLGNSEVNSNSEASEDYSESDFKKHQKSQEDEDIDLKSKILFKLLDEGTDEAPMPVVYVEHFKDDALQYFPEMGQASKRSGRYYRRYPWKRQNTRYRAATANRLRGQNTYEADLRYLCVPSRDDIFNLLASLHDTKNGNSQKTVNFCNRKRPVQAIFTNIRFLG